MENNKPNPTNTKKVSCSGDSYSKHPHIYLKIAHDKKDVVCPYCSRKFVFTESK